MLTFKFSLHPIHSRSCILHTLTAGLLLGQTLFHPLILQPRRRWRCICLIRVKPGMKDDCKHTYIYACVHTVHVCMYMTLNQTWTMSRSPGQHTVDIQMYVYISFSYACTCVNLNVHMHIHIQLHIYIHIYIHMNIYLHVYAEREREREKRRERACDD